MTQTSMADNAHLLELLPLISKTVISAAAWKELGHTKTHLLIFAALHRHGDLTMSQIASYIASSKEQATRAVAPLVDDGLLERYTDPVNRTRVHIRLTEKGRRLMEQFHERFLRNLREIMRESITDAEMAELKQAVDTMIRILGKL